MNRVDALFQRLSRDGRKAFMPFIAAGDPTLEATAAILRTLQDRGAAHMVELGLPFSDPIADGPVIQESYQRSLAGGITPQAIFDTLAALRAGGLELPVCVMTSYSLVFRPGVEEFVGRAAASGVDGLIVPDLPADESDDLCATLKARGMVYIPLVAPTTTPVRRKKILAHASGFIYCVSVTGITGERTKLPAGLAEYVRGVKKAAKVPVCVGFGISRPEHVAAVAKVADGVIVGSAIVRHVASVAGQPPDAVARAVADLCDELAAPIR